MEAEKKDEKKTQVTKGTNGNVDEAEGVGKGPEFGYPIFKVFFETVEFPVFFSKEFDGFVVDEVINYEVGDMVFGLVKLGPGADIVGDEELGGEKVDGERKDHQSSDFPADGRKEDKNDKEVDNDAGNFDVEAMKEVKEGIVAAFDGAD